MKLLQNLTNWQRVLPVFILLIISSMSCFSQGAMGFLAGEGLEPAGATAEFFSMQLDRFNAAFFVRMAIDLISMIILIRLIYFRVDRRYDFFFTFFMFNLIIFIITVLMNSNSGISMGAAFGLFAIFAMLRYRTEDISTRDMTYLFMSITIGLISSINMGSVLEIIIINVVILFTAFLIEGNVLVKPMFSKAIEYEKIDLIKPENKEALMSDLRNRTGLNIQKVYVKRIDFLRDIALLKIYYTNQPNTDA